MNRLTDIVRPTKIFMGNKDFQQFMEKFSEKPELNNIIFHEVDNIHQVLPLVFV